MATIHPRQLLGKLDRLESLRSPVHNGHDQRRSRRFTIRGEAELRPMSRNSLNPMPVEVKLRDVGPGGIGFICDRPLQADSTWQISFMLQGFQIAEQAVVIRHCRELDEDLYLIGAQVILPTGLLVGLGVDPGELSDGSCDGEYDCESGQFVTPGEVD